MRIVILLCVLLTLFACAPKAEEFTEADKTEIINLIEANMKKLQDSANALDTSALEEFLIPGPAENFYMIGAAYSKEELISATQQEYAGYATQTLSVTDHTVKVLDPNTAIWFGQIAAGSTDKEGLEYKLTFTDTWLWEKSGDTWQVSHLHESWE
ncbi:hypothetical protein DSECCO2_595520 [anaerobic digester metagenome]